MSDPQRAKLGAAQEELLHALLSDGPAPDGFNLERLRIEGRSLLAKRRGIVAALAPEVADALGTRFRPLFDTYARAHPRLAGSRARDDAAAFGKWAVERGELPAPTKRRGRVFRRRDRKGSS